MKKKKKKALVIKVDNWFKGDHKQISTPAISVFWSGQDTFVFNIVLFIFDIQFWYVEKGSAEMIGGYII